MMVSEIIKVLNFYLESIQILKEIIGVESTTLAVETMVELAWMYVDMQDYEKAIEILIESKNIQKNFWH